MQRRRWMVGIALAAGLALVLGATRRQPGPVRFTFEETTEGWRSVSADTDLDLSLTPAGDAAQVRVGRRALKAHYRVPPGKLPALVRPVDGLAGAGVRVWLRTDTPTMLVLGLVERDGSSYMHMVRTPPDRWEKVETPFSRFRLSDDARDENGRLDLDQVGTLIIADAGGLLPGAGGERTLWVDQYEVSGGFAPSALKAYRPMNEAGMPSPSGARATTGLTYRPGRFGLGLLTASIGALATVPVRAAARPDSGWRWEQGTVEMWVRPQFDMADVRDYTALLAMQNEPFITGYHGSLLLFYTRTRQIAFLLNGSLENVLGTPPLSWKAGQWHHLATTWGPAGMRLYLDGKLAAQNHYTGGPGIPTADVVMGNHAWTMLSDRYADTVLDELRISRRQRTEEEVSADALAPAPLAADADTVALEHFEGQPLPPVHLAPGGAPFHAVPAGRTARLAVIAPGATRGAVLTCALARVGEQPGGNRAVMLRRYLAGPPPEARGEMVLPPLADPGFYRVVFRLRKGSRTLNIGADWVRVLPDIPPTARSSVLFSASGCYADPHDREEFFRVAAASGVRSLRMPFEWVEIEPAEGCFVWGKYDRIVRWASRYGVELVPTFIWEKPQPAWAGRGTARKGNDEERYPPEDMVKWRRFVSAVVRRYRAHVRWWIPANEPNLSRYWHPKPDAKAYVALLKATWEAARREDPRARILGCSVSGTDLRFLEECFQAGALRYCDAVGIHPYICPRSPDERIPINIMDPSSRVGTFRDGLMAARDMIRRYDGNQPLWLDEAGQPTRDDFVAPDWSVSEEVAAGYLAKFYAESRATGAVDRVMWFSFWGGPYGSFALVKPDGSPTLPLAAYAAAVERLGGSSPVTASRRGAGVTVRAFQRGGRRLEVIWCAAGERDVNLRAGERAYDIYGFPRRAAASSRRVRVGVQPIYVEQVLIRKGR